MSAWIATVLLSLAALSVIWRSYQNRLAEQMKLDIAAFERRFPGRCYFCSFYRHMRANYVERWEQTPEHHPCREAEEPRTYRDDGRTA